MRRSSLPSVQYDRPRPDSCRGEFTARTPSNSECTQTNSPVSALRAMMLRRVPAVAYSIPLTTSGVPSSLNSGFVPRLSVLKRHATSSLLKFCALIWSSGEYLAPVLSPVYAGQSPFFVVFATVPLPPVWPDTHIVMPATATINPTTRNDVDGFRDIVHPPFRKSENLSIRLAVFYRLISTIPTLFTPLHAM